MDTVRLRLQCIEKYESWRPFTDKEAWFLFRAAAFAEAGGWTLLLIGISIRRFLFPHSNTSVLVTGQIHGTFFTIYILIVLLTYSSLTWSRKRMFFAGLASVPPYGSLVFEKWAAYKRKTEALRTYREVSVYAVIIKDGALLVVQSRDEIGWHVPGGSVGPDATIESSFNQIIAAQTGVLPNIQRLVLIRETQLGHTHKVAMYFSIKNNTDFEEQSLQTANKISKNFEVIRYVKPAQMGDFEPAILSDKKMLHSFEQAHGKVLFI